MKVLRKLQKDTEKLQTILLKKKTMRSFFFRSRSKFVFHLSQPIDERPTYPGPSDLGIVFLSDRLFKLQAVGLQLCHDGLLEMSKHGWLAFNGCQAVRVLSILAQILKVKKKRKHVYITYTRVLYVLYIIIQQLYKKYWGLKWSIEFTSQILLFSHEHHCGFISPPAQQSDISALETRWMRL